MTHAKRIAIVVLVCVNIALLGALVHFNTPKAQAQEWWKSTDYVAITAQATRSLDILYIIDLEAKKMIGFKWDKTRKLLIPLQGRTLTKDFKVK